MNEILVENEGFRFDSEYFKKEYIEIYKNFYGSLRLRNVCSMTDLQSNGSFAQISNILNDNLPKTHPYIRSGNIGLMFIDKQNLEYISTRAHQKLLKTHTYLYDCLMARKGKIGGASIIMSNEVGFNSNDNIVNIKVVDKYINPFYFTMFLNSKFGLQQIARLATGNVQPWLSMQQIRNLCIIKLAMPFQTKIENIVKTAHNKIQQGEFLYVQAEQLLLQELDLVNFEPSTANIAVKKLTESFRITGRFDAEYYQPKYEEILEKIKKTHYNVLGEIVIVKKSIEPGSNAYQDSGIPFVRIADFSKYGISHNNVHLNPNFLDAKKLDNLYPKKNTILLSKDGTVGIAYHIKNEENIITSSALLHLKIKSSHVLPEYLALVLNSIIVKLQGDRDIGGSIIKHWIPSEIEKVLIPLIKVELQQQIESKVQESFALRKESKRLLDVAKQGVEMAIEQSEEVAIGWLNEIGTLKENTNVSMS